LFLYPAIAEKNFNNLTNFLTGVAI
jgi:hypothetical protein